MSNSAHLSMVIDLEALADNYKKLSALAAPASVAGIVKANAYGVGVDEVVPVLETLNCPLYFVADINEAYHVRSLTMRPVMVLSGLTTLPSQYSDASITPVINNFEHLSIWRAHAKDLQKKLDVVLHFDTGMNRLGFDIDDAKKFSDDHALLENLNLIYVMSHFSSSDDCNQIQTKKQYEDFKNIAGYFPNVALSLANSSGLFRNPKDYALSLVRPGAALYGLNPLPEQDNPMAPVIKSYAAQILQIKNLKANTAIGYNGTQSLPYDAQLAVVSIGYADGLPRSGSGHHDKNALSGVVFHYNNEPCRTVGRISMDLTIVDITSLKEKPKVGEFLHLVNTQHTIDHVASDCKTIGYEILTQLSQRATRFYS
jgi:alanine racemase